MKNRDKTELNWAGEPVPSEEEQELWSKIAALITLFLALLVFL